MVVRDFGLCISHYSLKLFPGNGHDSFLFTITDWALIFGTAVENFHVMGLDYYLACRYNNLFPAIPMEDSIHFVAFGEMFIYSFQELSSDVGLDVCAAGGLN